MTYNFYVGSCATFVLMPSVMSETQGSWSWYMRQLCVEVLLEDSQGLPARWCLASKDRWEKVSLQADCEKPKFSLIYILVIFKLLYAASVQFSHSVVSNSLWLYGLQHSRLPHPSPTPGAYSNSYPSRQWCHPLLSPSPPSFNLSQHLGLFQWIGSLHQVAKVLEFQLQFFQQIFRTDFL